MTTMTLHDICEQLGLAGLAGRTQRRRINDLIVRHGFPRPLPGVRVWSRLLVEAWIAGNGAVAPAAPLAVSYVEDARARLEARIRSRAA